MADNIKNMTPKQIVAELDKYIIGQDEAKKYVAIALRNRYRRSLLSEEMREEISPKNILMMGPTGVGKTEIARRLAKLMDAPFVKEAMLLFGIYAGILFISLFQNCKPLSRFLLFTNRYSLQIYLLHTIFTAGIRIVLVRLNVSQWWVHVIVGTVFGFACSVLIAVIAEKMKWPNLFFFPTKTYCSIKKKA
jgi:hypothetical protein